MKLRRLQAFSDLFHVLLCRARYFVKVFVGSGSGEARPCGEITSIDDRNPGGDRVTPGGLVGVGD